MPRASAVTEAQIWVSELTTSIAVTVFIAVVTVLVLLFFGLWKFKTKVLPSQSESTRKYRFRKRDKVMFFGRKMLRKVKSFTRNTVGPSSGLRRKPSNRLMISRLRRFLAERRESNKPRLKQQSPPQSFLEADWSDIGEDSRLPPEVLYMLRSVRVFGHLEKPFFLELIRYMETINLRSGNFLFKIGDPDDSIFVVQNGLLEVFITDTDGTEHLVKEVATGASIHSLLSILDVLTGHPGVFRSVSARAVTDSTILRLPAHAFNSMFDKFNESAVKVVQIIMVRLQRVTFSALHNYLGLSKELLKPDGQGDLKELNIQRVNRQSSTGSMGSPTKTPSLPPLAEGHPSGATTVKPSLASTGESWAGSSASRHAAHAARARAGDPGTEESEERFQTPPHNLSQHRKSNASVIMGETSRQLSDFDQALMRARVSVTDEKSIVLSGSPPRARRWSTDPSGAAATFRARNLPDENFILSLASKDLVQILGLKDPDLLKDRLTLKRVKAGSIFCRQGDQETSLFFVVKGTISVMQNVVGESSKETNMYHVEPGEIIDVLAVLTGEPSFFTMRPKTDAIIVVISKLDFYQIMRSEPFIVLNVAHQSVKRMSNFVRQIDFALDWQMLEAGKALFRQGDTSDSIFIVLTGRLRSVFTTTGGKKELVNEFGRGELVGIVEVLTQNERATTVLAIRDTEVTKIPSELLSLIKLRYPQVVARLIHLLGTRILGNLQQRNDMNLQESFFQDNGDVKMERSTVANLATIAIVPVTEDVPLTNFSLELQHALLDIGPTVRLTPDIVRARLGTAALDGVNEFRLFNWLSQQEDIHRMVLYQCDHQLTKWSKHCLRQADCILIVALADKDPTIGPIEKELENIAVRAQKELVLLHREDAETPRNTAEWLNARGWLSSHHHLRCPKRVLKAKSPAKTLELYEKLFDHPPNKMADFSRLARFLTGTSIGLVLGGGGARGLAHVGMIKAMTEEGIPIDMVGGTSMGAFIGALWAEERQWVPFTRRAREWSMGMTSLWKKIWDLTYPMTSMFTGWAFNESIETVFRDRQIEDLWIPYFCITTNISNSSMRVHSLGSIWRYVRASMSLSGYLPPLCDPADGHLLLDGGYVNNLPADVMHTLGAKFVFAVDVGSQDEKDHTNYGDTLSGWWLLWKRWNPWAKPVKVPDMTEIQSRLAYVSCVRQLELVKTSDYCEYIRPPIDRYATLQFGAYDEIMETGYHHGKTLFSTWTKGGLMDKLFAEDQAQDSTQAAGKGVKESKLQARNQMPVMAYFTDLAEQVSKIDQPRSKFFIDGSEDEIFEEVDEDEDDAAALMDGYEEDDEFANTEEEEEEDDEDFDEEDEVDDEDNNEDVKNGNEKKRTKSHKVTSGGLTASVSDTGLVYLYPQSDGVKDAAPPLGLSGSFHALVFSVSNNVVGDKIDREEHSQNNQEKPRATVGERDFRVLSELRDQWKEFFMLHLLSHSREEYSVSNNQLQEVICSTSPSSYHPNTAAGSQGKFMDTTARQMLEVEGDGGQHLQDETASCRIEIAESLSAPEELKESDTKDWSPEKLESRDTVKMGPGSAKSDVEEKDRAHIVQAATGGSTGKLDDSPCEALTSNWVMAVGKDPDMDVGRELQEALTFRDIIVPPRDENDVCKPVEAEAVDPLSGRDGPSLNQLRSDLAKAVLLHAHVSPTCRKAAESRLCSIPEDGWQVPTPQQSPDLHLLLSPVRGRVEHDAFASRNRMYRPLHKQESSRAYSVSETVALREEIVRESSDVTSVSDLDKMYTQEITSNLDTMKSTEKNHPVTCGSKSLPEDLICMSYKANKTGNLAKVCSVDDKKVPVTSGKTALCETQEQGHCERDQHGVESLVHNVDKHTVCRDQTLGDTDAENLHTGNTRCSSDVRVFKGSQRESPIKQTKHKDDEIYKSRCMRQDQRVTSGLDLPVIDSPGIMEALERRTLMPFEGKHDTVEVVDTVTMASPVTVATLKVTGSDKNEISQNVGGDSSKEDELSTGKVEKRSEVTAEKLTSLASLTCDSEEGLKLLEQENRSRHEKEGSPQESSGLDFYRKLSREMKKELRQFFKHKFERMMRLDPPTCLVPDGTRPVVHVSADRPTLHCGKETASDQIHLPSQERPKLCSPSKQEHGISETIHGQTEEILCSPSNKEYRISETIHGQTEENLSSAPSLAAGRENKKDDSSDDESSGSSQHSARFSRSEIHKIILETDSDSDLEIMSTPEKLALLRYYSMLSEDRRQNSKVAIETNDGVHISGKSLSAEHTNLSSLPVSNLSQLSVSGSVKDAGVESMVGESCPLHDGTRTDESLSHCVGGDSSTTQTDNSASTSTEASALSKLIGKLSNKSEASLTKPPRARVKVKALQRSFAQPDEKQLRQELIRSAELSWRCGCVQKHGGQHDRPVAIHTNRDRYKGCRREGSAQLSKVKSTSTSSKGNSPAMTGAMASKQHTGFDHMTKVKTNWPQKSGKSWLVKKTDVDTQDFEWTCRFKASAKWLTRKQMSDSSGHKYSSDASGKFDPLRKCSSGSEGKHGPLLCAGREIGGKDGCSKHMGAAAIVSAIENNNTESGQTDVDSGCCEKPSHEAAQDQAEMSETLASRSNRLDVQGRKLGLLPDVVISDSQVKSETAEEMEQQRQGCKGLAGEQSHRPNVKDIKEKMERTVGAIEDKKGQEVDCTESGEERDRTRSKDINNKMRGGLEKKKPRNTTEKRQIIQDSGTNMDKKKAAKHWQVRGKGNSLSSQTEGDLPTVKIISPKMLAQKDKREQDNLLGVSGLGVRKEGRASKRVKATSLKEERERKMEVRHRGSESFKFENVSKGDKTKASCIQLARAHSDLGGWAQQGKDYDGGELERWRDSLRVSGRSPSLTALLDTAEKLHPRSPIFSAGSSNSRHRTKSSEQGKKKGPRS